jgi:predicted nucleotidyltransferase
MEVNKLKFTRLQGGLFRMLCIKAGEPLTQFEAAKAIGASQTAVSKALGPLVREGLAKVEKKHGRLFIELDRESRKATELKMTENLRMVFESGLVPAMEEKFPGAAIILFGSYSRGEDTMKSDIDIAVVGSKQKAVYLGRFEKQLGRDINLQFYDSFKSIDKELKENILSGILLAGRIEL